MFFKVLTFASTALLGSHIANAQVITGDGPRPPALTTPAKEGSWTPPAGSGASLTGMGRDLYINSATDFCLLMPPDPVNQNLVDAEAVAVSYCIKPTNGTRPMPDGFIKTAHYRETADYVQISGTYDPAIMNLAANDCGGEYDNHGAEGVGNPVGVNIKNGYTNFFEFIGGCDIPGNAVFCLRTCKGDQSYPYCRNSLDLMGCLFTMPGDYDTPGFTNCQADPGLVVGAFNATYTFSQGMTPTPTIAPPAPQSSQCTTTASPTASGVTYTWNQEAAAAQTAATTTTSSARGTSTGQSSSGTNSNAAKGDSHLGALGLLVTSTLGALIAAVIVL
ncbi:hypothetical protein IE53DRAFT_136437 [Violaceomyces palustris]|uniref:Uncharacterized protein n=1 Tax=Violaceomyces palustris TaxID=1673888 RepID=A0ACD0NV11_9BASI|nr:hypothetical protein IE53DRAFT_136437 [Violaceomyces palustris]